MIDDKATALALRPALERDWRTTYARRLAITDLLVLIWVVFGVQIAWLDFDDAAMGSSSSRGLITISYTTVSIVIIASWMILLGVLGSRGHRVIGAGSQEYKLLSNAAVRLFGAFAIVAFLFKVDFARGYILIAFPLGLLVLIVSRWIWRQWLSVQRQRGNYSSRVLLVGSENSVGAIAREFARNYTAGYKVVGACVPTGRIADVLPGTQIPVLSNVNNALDAMRASGADTVVLTSSDELSPERVRQLSWGLEPGRQHLVVAPSLVDMGGPRIHTRPVAGLPLIHVETPRFEGGKTYAKRGFDIVASGLIIAVLSPVLLIVALTVKLSGPGPILFRQSRVGIGGRSFEMLKFRSMVQDAEERLKNMQGLKDGVGNPVLFKMSNDPRVTPVGRVLRRLSLDELPQLFNVFGGSMSLVGPRPPLEREVSMYEAHVHRRFLVKPGITGLWQVSGRSNLSWEDSVRLDLYYVENWSLTGDLVILWRTIRAVFASEGAY